MPYNREQNTRNAYAWRQRAWETLVSAMGGECCCCGYDQCRKVFDLHHVNSSEKEATVSSLLARRTWGRVVAEARKCILVCCRCHREIHAGFRKSPKPHRYTFPEKLREDRKYVKRPCPISTRELRRLRSIHSYRQLAVIFKANRRTVIRWCNKLLGG